MLLKMKTKSKSEICLFTLVGLRDPFERCPSHEPRDAVVEGDGHSLAGSVGEQVEREFQEAAPRQRRQRQTQRLLSLDVRCRSLVFSYDY